jgi:hypothetical protein
MSLPRRAAAGLLLLALLLLSGWIAVHGRDAPLPDDGDLRLAKPAPAPADNGYAQFEAASDAAQLPHDAPTWDRFHAFRAGKTWEPDWISELVAQNAAATALLRTGIASPAFAFPAHERAANDRLRTLYRVQQLVALSGAQARIALRDADPHDAIELASLGLRAGRRLSAAENPDLFAISMTIAFQTLSLLDLESAARSTRVSPDSARELGALLESTRWRAQDWQRVWGLEYTRLRAALGGLDAARAAWPLALLPDAYRWHPNATAAALADYYREQGRKSASSCADVLARGARLVPVTAASLFAPNGLGRLVIHDVRAQSYDDVQRQRCQFETQVSLVEVMIAVKAYSDAEGHLPERLDELVPRYLAALPLDRYDGAPLRYARAIPAVYSVGDDLADTGAGAPPSPDDPREPGLLLAF